MKEKIETALRRAAEQLPQPDFQVMADTPVQPLEVHDYVTRQEFLPPRRRVRPAAAALVLCALLLCAGLWVYFQFFQIYTVVDLRVNPSFSIELDRRDQVRTVRALTEDAQPILEGRSYQGWDLEAAIGALLDDLSVRGYLTDGAEVDVAVNSKSADHGRDLREDLEEFITQKLSGLGSGNTQVHMESTPSPQVTQPAPTTPAASTPSSAPSAPVSNTSGQDVMTWDEAKAIVTARLPEAQFDEIKLDDDDGRLIYELKFRDGNRVEYEADLDAITGEILKWEKD